MLIQLPSEIVDGIHSNVVQQGLCQNAVESDFNISQEVICSCHTDELASYPSLSIRVIEGHTIDVNDVEVLQLSAIDYLGEPYLNGHSVQC